MQDPTRDEMLAVLAQEQRLNQTGETTMRAQRHILAQALRIAAAQYGQDAAFYQDDAARLRGETMHPEGRARLRQCFEDQAKVANKLADDIEQADRIELHD